MIIKFEAYKPYIPAPKIKTAWLIPSRHLDEFAGALISIGMSDEGLEFWTSKRYEYMMA